MSKRKSNGDTGSIPIFDPTVMLGKVTYELNNKNFITWQMFMRNILNYYGLEDWVDENKTPKIKSDEGMDIDGEEYLKAPFEINTYYDKNVTEDDLKTDRNIQFLIRYTLGPNCQQDIQDRSLTSYEMWKLLEDIYLGDKIERKNRLIKETNSLKYDPKESFSRFVNKLNSNFNKLEQLNVKIDDEEKIGLLYQALPEKYRKVTVLKHEDWEECKKDTARMIDKMNKFDPKEKSETFGIRHIFSVEGSYKGDKRKESTKYYRNKQSNNHNKNTNKGKEKSNEERNWNNKNKQNITCYFCHQKGHTVKQCRIQKELSEEVTRRLRKEKNKGKEAFLATGEIVNKQTTEDFEPEVGYQDLFTVDYNALFDNNNDECNNKSCNYVSCENVPTSFTTWTLDSGASNHITKDIGILKNVFEHVEPINYANGATTKSTHMGEVNGSINEEPIKLEDVMYIPDVKRNLISVAKLVKSGYQIIFDEKNNNVFAYIKDKKTDNVYEVKANEYDVFNLYIKEGNVVNNYSMCDNVRNNGEYWHRRIGHLNFNNNDEKNNIHNCTICMRSKMKEIPHKRSDSRASSVLELVHIDLVGPITPSIHDNVYFLSILDDYSRYGWVIFVKNKSDVFKEFGNWLNKTTNELSSKVKYLRSDNGTEFTSNNFKELCNEYGITQQFTVPGNPEQNGRAERFNGKLIKTATAMLMDARLCRRFWEDAVKTANYVHNRVPHSGINGEIPFELMYNRKVDYKNLRVFGCKVYYLDDSNIPKFQDKTKEGIFIGYDESSVGYRIFDIKSRKIKVKRVVGFLEEEPGDYNYNLEKENNNETYSQDTETFQVRNFNYMYDKENENNNNKDKKEKDISNENDKLMNENLETLNDKTSNKEDLKEVNYEEKFRNIEEKLDKLTSLLNKEKNNSSESFMQVCEDTNDSNMSIEDSEEEDLNLLDYIKLKEKKKERLNKNNYQKIEEMEENKEIKISTSMESVSETNKEKENNNDISGSNDGNINNFTLEENNLKYNNLKYNSADETEICEIKEVNIKRNDDKKNKNINSKDNSNISKDNKRNNKYLNAKGNVYFIEENSDIVNKNELIEEVLKTPSEMEINDLTGEIDNNDFLNILSPDIDLGTRKKIDFENIESVKNNINKNNRKEIENNYSNVKVNYKNEEYYKKNYIPINENEIRRNLNKENINIPEEKSKFKNISDEKESNLNNQNKKEYNLRNLKNKNEIKDPINKDKSKKKFFDKKKLLSKQNFLNKRNLNRKLKSNKNFKLNENHPPKEEKFPRKRKLVPSEDVIEEKFSKPHEHEPEKKKIKEVALTIAQIKEPNSYNDIFKRKDKDKWIKAIEAELLNMKERKVFKRIDEVPEDANIIDSRWVFKIKRNSTGEIEKYKARLVARGFTQEYGEDYNETFSPTLKQDSLRILIGIAAINNYKIHQLDVKAAYLYADLKEDIYMKAPEGDKMYKKGLWKLNKALYGLKQAAREWNNNISNTLIELGFQKLVSEPCIFIKTKNNKLVCLVGIYVDDILITGKKEEIDKTIKLIKEKYVITDVGDANFIIGIKVETLKDGYLLHQERYLKDILHKFGLENCRGSKTTTPIKNDEQLNQPFDPTTYRAAIGSLLYLAIGTRPDILFSVTKASRFSQNPTIQNWKNVLQIFKYLKENPHYGIRFERNLNLKIFVDSDYGGDEETRKSTTGFVFLLGNGPTSWYSKLQKCVSTSTAEAEYYGLCECSKQALWYRNIFSELKIKEECLKINIDNQATIYNANNETINPKSKHIDIKYHKVRELIKENKISLEYIKSEENLADGFTKYLNKNKMKIFRDSLLYKYK